MSKTLKQLKDAVRAADIESVKQLLQEGVDPNHMEGFQKTSPLSLACVRGQPDIVKLLLEKLESAPGKVQKEIYQSSLEKAITSTRKDQSLKVTRVLLCMPESDSSGALKNELEFLNQSWSDSFIANIAFDLAITKAKDAELVRLVLNRFKVQQDMIAHYLNHVCANNADMLAVLLEIFSRHVDSLLDNGWSLLMRESASGYNKGVEVLLEHGADIDFQDEGERNTALMAAVRKGNVETVKLLLEKGASVDVVNKQGQTALLTNTLKLSQDQQYIYRNYVSNVEIIQALLAKNADVNKQDDRGRTALVNAVQNNSVEAVKLLLDNGAKTNVLIDNYKPLLNTAIDQALRKPLQHRKLHDNEIPKLLLQYGAPINLKDGKLEETPLIVACKTMNAEMCRLLLDKRASVKLFDRRGACALLHAARLINPDQYSQLPAQFLHDPAVQEMNLEIVEMLLKHNKDTLYSPDEEIITAADILHTSAIGNISSEKFPELKKVVTSLTSRGQADVTSSDETTAEQTHTPSSLPPPASQPHQTSPDPSTSGVSSEQPAANVSSSLPPPKLHPHTQTSPDPHPDPTSIASSEQPATETSSSLASPELAQASEELLDKQDNFGRTAAVENKSVEALFDNEAKTTGSANTSTTRNPVPAWQRKFDVVLYGVPESKGRNNYERVTDDLESAHSILHKISNAISDDSIRDCTRMGKYSMDKTRPLLVKLVRERDARLILHSLTPEDLDGMAVKRHMSPTERQAESILLKKRWELTQSGSGLDKEHLKIRGNKLFQDSAPIGEVVGGAYKQILT